MLQDRDEYERLMSEMARLRESWVTQELARISLAAREAGYWRSWPASIRSYFFIRYSQS